MANYECVRRTQNEPPEAFFFAAGVPEAPVLCRSMRLRRGRSLVYLFDENLAGLTSGQRLGSPAPQSSDGER